MLLVLCARALNTTSGWFSEPYHERYAISPIVHHYTVTIRWHRLSRFLFHPVLTRASEYYRGGSTLPIPSADLARITSIG